MSVKHLIRTAALAVVAAFTGALGAHAQDQGPKPPDGDAVLREAIPAVLGAVPFLGTGLSIFASTVLSTTDYSDERRAQALRDYVDLQIARLTTQQLEASLRKLRVTINDAAEYGTGIYRVVDPDTNAVTIETRAREPERATRLLELIDTEVDGLLGCHTACQENELGGYLHDLATTPTNAMLISAGTLAVLRIQAMEQWGELTFGDQWPPAPGCSFTPVNPDAPTDAERACSHARAIEVDRSLYRAAFEAQIPAAVDRRAEQITFTDWHDSGAILDVVTDPPCAQEMVQSLRHTSSFEDHPVTRTEHRCWPANIWGERECWEEEIHLGNHWYAFGVLDYHLCTIHEVPRNDTLMTANYPCGTTTCPVTGEYRTRFTYIMAERATYDAFLRGEFIEGLNTRSGQN